MDEKDVREGGREGRRELRRGEGGRCVFKHYNSMPMGSSSYLSSPLSDSTLSVLSPVRLYLVCPLPCQTLSHHITVHG